MELNVLAIALATIAQFVVGAVWYSALFGKKWGEIHGFNTLSPEVQKEMMSKMGPIYGIQFVITIIGAVALAILLNLVPNYSPFVLALLVWIGFIVPAQVSAVLFGGTEEKFMLPKIAIQMGAALACILAGAAVLNAF